MQCSSCGFENMPGSDACARCASSLRLATAVMDVRPPRAGKFAKRLRRVLPARRAYFGVRDAFQDVHLPRPGGLNGLFDELPRAPLLWRLPIPGWSHFYADQRVRGHVFLWSYLALLLPGLLFMGTTTGSLLLGLAFSVHSSAALDVLNGAAPRNGLRQMLARSIIVSLVLAVCFYLPLSWLLARVAAARAIALTTEPFREGDVVLVNQAWHADSWPLPGQVVLYQLTPRRTEAVNGRIFEFAGERVDRVLAVGGDKVLWAKGKLIVNGVPSPWRPLNEAVLPARLALTVPPDRVFIIPSTTPNLGPASDAHFWQSLACVPRDQVAGTVYLRSQPLSRLKVIR